jgi:hypothetical protein
MRFRRRWIVAAGIVAGFLAGLAACETTFRQDRVAMCRRALPALAPGPTVKFEGAGAGQTSGTVWVDYSEAPWPHRLVCRFDAIGLVEVTTDGKRLSGPSLYMLRRYYLDTPDAEEADPSGH